MSKDLHLKFAKALYKLAQKEQKTAQYFEQLTAVNSLLVADKALRDLMMQLSVLDMEKILELVSGAFGKHSEAGILNMLALLVANRQMKLIPLIQKSFQKIYFDAEGISDLIISTSRELSEAEKSEIAKKFIKKNAHITYKVEADLIGGLRIYENGQLTDFSLRSQLNQLRGMLIGENN